MLEPLIKSVSTLGPDGLWGVFNNSRHLTCSPDGYMLAIAREEIGRLDDFTLEEERQFWDFAFTSAAKGLHDAAKRGLTLSENQPEKCSVMCVMNDGFTAWQNVGTSHAHIVWTSTPETIGDLQERLQQDRAFFMGEDSYAPLATTTVKLTAPKAADDIRTARHTLAKEFNAKGGTLGFSLYTKKAHLDDPRNGADFVIEAWDEIRPSVASLSQSIRYWHNLVESPLNGKGIGLKYSCFRKEIP